MGLFDAVVSRVRAAFSRSKDTYAKELARGATASTLASGYGKDVLNLYGTDSYSAYLSIEQDLLSKYADYEEMDDRPELTQSLNIIADEATQTDYERRVPIWIESQDKTLEQILGDDLLKARLNFAEEELWEITRSVCKYGSDFEEILTDNTGVVGLNYLPPATMRRIEDSRGFLHGFIQDFRGRYGYTPDAFKIIMQRRFEGTNDEGDQFNLQDRPQSPSYPKAVAFEDWEVAHFRLRTKFRRTVYGQGVFESSRWIFKRLEMLEDSVLIYRLERAPERFAFYVDVGNLPPAEALSYVNKVRQQYRKKKYVGPDGKLNMRWEPSSQMDDFYIPTRKGQDGARVEVLGAPGWQCLVGETEIPLLNGTYKTIKEMAEEGGSWKVFSVNSLGQTVTGLAHSARISHESAEIWEIGLADGKVVRCTHNHPFLMLDDSWVLADNLVVGSNLRSTVYDCVRVVSVRNTGERAPVYDLTVDEHHNFAIGQGVFVHNSVEDINYFLDKMFASVYVPRSYLAKEAGVTRQILSSQDVMFARLIIRIQRSVRTGTRHVCDVHLAAIGMDPRQMAPYEVHMAIPSAIYELAQLEIMNARADLASRLKEFFSEYYLLSNIFKLQDESIAAIMQQRQGDFERSMAQQVQSQQQLGSVQLQQQAQMQGVAAQAQGAAQPAQKAAENWDALVRRSADGFSVAPYSRNSGIAQARYNPKMYEQSIMKGDKASEHRLTEKLDRLLQNDSQLMRRMTELGGLLRDLAQYRSREE